MPQVGWVTVKLFIILEYFLQARLYQILRGRGLKRERGNYFPLASFVIFVE